MRQHLLSDLFAAQGRRIVGRPVGDLFKQRRPIIAPIQVIMTCVLRENPMIAELDEVRGRVIVSVALPGNDAGPW